MGIVIGLILGIAAGAAAGYIIRNKQGEARIGSAEARAADLLDSAKREADTQAREVLVAAQDEGLKMRQQVEEELRARRTDADKRESRVGQREDQQVKREHQAEERERELDRAVAKLDAKAADLQQRAERLEAARGDV